MTLRKDDGSAVTVDTRRPSQSHWEHDYAKTIYKAQGKTAEHVLVNAEASAQQLFSQKAFLVAISRQREAIHLFTDDTGKFTSNVRYNLGDKTSAIESRRAAESSPARAALDRAFGRRLDEELLERSAELSRERGGPSLEMS